MPSRHRAIVESPSHSAHGPAVLQTVWHSEDDTRHFAERLARGLMQWPGGHDARIELHGDLGAGKTTLVRHLLRAAGVQGRIKSPTYAVVEPHTALADGEPWPVWHFDFYRFNDPQEWADAGFRELMAGPGLKVMEWPEKAAGQLPVADLQIHLQVGPEDRREVEVVASTARGRHWLEALRAH
jgi:tRNA threonylcarbamoyladenosine biosynthesis protein TsaE